MVEQKPKLKQYKTAPKPAEKTRLATLKCATEKKFRHSSSTKSINVIRIKTGSGIDNVSPRGFNRKGE